LPHRVDPVLEVGLDLVLVPGVGVDHVPAKHRSLSLSRLYRSRTLCTTYFQARSLSQMYVPMMTQAISTTTVPWITWLWLGHSTFRSSPTGSTWLACCRRARRSALVCLATLRPTVSRGAACACRTSGSTC